LKVIALIVSGGEGKRFDKNLPKQFFKVNDKTILEHCVKKFVDSNLFYKIVVVCNKGFINESKKILYRYNLSFVNGGKSRQESVYYGLKSIKKDSPGKVLIHDAVRPFFSINLINEIIKKLETNDSVIPSLKVFDSIRLLEKREYKNLHREDIKLIQTPQGFDFKKIYDAHKKFKNDAYTDDSLIFYRNGNKIKIISGEIMNIKVTEKKDFQDLKKIYEKKNNDTNFRIGNGFDVHKFKKGGTLKLLVVNLPFNKSLIGHSDADVGIHALVDAILGAISQGDIGEHFPPTDAKWKNKDSEFFLDYTKNLMERNGFSINNIDITLICERPKISKYKEKMKGKVAKILNIKKNNINIKATTTEKLGFLGREEGIACQVSVLVFKKNGN
jgi:2-C-methyl-D-erythritol 4-phosphate cytidylyltransferase/2-C-methyl-D-erythritol 2,4-cyclodiphosphate synthase